MTADIHLLTGAYALDVVDDAVERQRFEHHLEQCAGCRDEVRALRETVAVLAEAAAVSPAPQLRERILAQVAVTPQLSGSPSRPSQPASRNGTGRRAPLVAAAVAVIAGGVLAGVGGVQLYRAEQAGGQAARALAIAADPGSRRVSGGLAGGGSATVAVSGGKAVFVALDVPALAAGRTYQLWIVRPGDVASAGLGPGGAAAGGRWSRLIDGVRPGDSVAISVEPSGGSPQPTTTPLTVLEV